MREPKFSQFFFLLLWVAALVGAMMVMPKIGQAALGVDEHVKQARSPESSTVYYLDHQQGKKKAYNNEQAFYSYGNTWGEVTVVEQDKLSSWPNIHLVKVSESPGVYYINKEKKARIPSEEIFQQQGFSWEEVVTITPVDLTTYQTVEWEEMDIAENEGGGSSQRKEVLVDLADSTPSGKDLPLGTEKNLVATYVLEAENGITTMENIKVKFEGVYDPDLIDKVHLELLQGDGYHVSRSVDDERKINFNLHSDPLIIPSGEEKQLGVYVDLDSGEDFRNNTFRAVLQEYSYINTSSWVSGDFPIKANSMGVVNAEGALPEILAERLSISGNTQAMIGSTDKIVAQYRLSETTGEDDVELQEMVLENQGSADEENISEFKLKDGEGDIIAEQGRMEGERIEFDLGDRELTASSSQNFTVLASIDGGEEKTIDLELVELIAQDETHGFNSSITRDMSDGQEFTIAREDLGVFARDLEVNDHVFDNQTGTLLGLYEIRTDTQDISLEDIRITVTKNGGTPDLNSSIYLIDYSTGEVLNYLNVGDLDDDHSSNVDIEEVSLDATEELELAIVSEIPNDAENGDTYQTSLKNVTYETDNGTPLTNEVDVSGREVNVNRSHIYLYQDNNGNDTSYIRGEEDVKLADFSLEASAGEDVEVRSITLERGSDASGSLSYDNGFSDLRVEIDGDQVGATISEPYSDSFTFQGFNQEVDNNSRAEIEVFVDTDSDLAVNNTQITISDIVAVGKNSGMETEVNNLGISGSVIDFGEMGAEVQMTSTGGVSPSQDDNLLGSFEVTNTGAEQINIENMVLETSTEGLSHSLGYSDLTIINPQTGDRESDIISEPVAGANEIDMWGYGIDPGETASFDIYVDTDGSVAGENFELYIPEMEIEGDRSDQTIFISTQGQGTIEVNTVSTGSGGESSNLSMIMPVEEDINYHFHDPDYPYVDLFEHAGIDIDASQGTEVEAAASGQVIGIADTESTSYNYIVIQHDSSIVTEYGHLSEVDVEVGDSISQGEVIGLSGGEPGTTGAGNYTTGSHLHFEVRVNGNPVDPMSYLN